MRLDSSECFFLKPQQALLRLLCLGYKDAMRRQRVENLRVAFGPCIVDFRPTQAPFLAIPDELTVIAVHQESILRPAPWTVARHEMLGHDVCVGRG